MPITKIIIENFKGICDRVEIPLKPITLLFGANSAGKSTILQALLYLREVLDRKNIDADELQISGTAIDLGGFRNFVNGQSTDKTIKIGISLTLEGDGLDVYPVKFPFESDDEAIRDFRENGFSDIFDISLNIGVSWSAIQQHPYVSLYETYINGEVFARIESETYGQSYLTYCNLRHSIFSEINIDEGVVQASLEEALLPWSLPSDDSSSGVFRIPLYESPIPHWGKALLPNISSGETISGKSVKKADDESAASAANAQFILSHLIVGPGEVALKELKNIRYLGPLRKIPNRAFLPQKSPRDDRWADGSAAWDLFFNKGSKETWFDEKNFRSLGLGYSVECQRFYLVPIGNSAIAAAIDRAAFEKTELHLSAFEEAEIPKEAQNLKEISRFYFVSENTGLAVEPWDVGIGVSQVFPVVAGAMASGCSVFAVEQPELHIHPAIQCALGDVIGHTAIKNTDRINLLETHSEHLMLRLLRRVRENAEGELPPDAPALKPEHLSVLYVENGENGMKIIPLPVGPDGDFENHWPKGFFEERFDEYS